MNSLQLTKNVSIIITHNENISHIENLSDQFITRARVYFKNGYSLSIVRGQGTYGAKSGLFEIGIFDKNDNWVPELFDNYTLGDDDVLGWQSADDVKSYINKIGEIK